MSEPIDHATLLELLGGDLDLFERLVDLGFLERRESFRTEEAEYARVAHTLVKELEVNWEGVEIILRMRSELLATRRQVAELLALLSRASR